MIDIYIGVDPSINSSGVTCLAYEDNKLVKEMYYIIKHDKGMDSDVNNSSK